jgi:hypothetical protein
VTSLDDATAGSGVGGVGVDGGGGGSGGGGSGGGGSICGSERGTVGTPSAQRRQLSSLSAWASPAAPPLQTDGGLGVTLGSLPPPSLLLAAGGKEPSRERGGAAPGRSRGEIKAALGEQELRARGARKAKATAAAERVRRAEDAMLREEDRWWEMASAFAPTAPATLAEFKRVHEDRNRNFPAKPAAWPLVYVRALFATYIDGKHDYVADYDALKERMLQLRSDCAGAEGGDAVKKQRLLERQQADERKIGEALRAEREGQRRARAAALAGMSPAQVRDSHHTMTH